MKRQLTVTFALLLAATAFSSLRIEQSGLVNTLPVIKAASCDTVIDLKGYRARIVKEEGELKQAGLVLFAEDIKKGEEKEVLLLIEEALLATSQGVKANVYDGVKITNGSIGDFKSITPDSPCSFSVTDSKSMTAEWNNGGKKTVVSVGMGYNVGKQGTRGDIENEFISLLKSADPIERNTRGNWNNDDLEPYADDMAVLPGGSYQSKDITGNTYYTGGENPVPVWSTEHPLESIANLFMLPDIGDGNTMVELTVMKHEYGDKETLTVPLSRLLAVSEEEGCMPFWGVERFDDGLLVSSLFLYNRAKGYDHVLKTECRPEDVIDNGGTIKARASLYIPTNNVRDLFAPYVRKSEAERIKYEGD